MGGHGGGASGREDAPQSRPLQETDGDGVKEEAAGAASQEAPAEEPGADAAAPVEAGAAGSAEGEGGAGASRGGEGGEEAEALPEDPYARLAAEHEKLQEEHEALQRKYEELRSASLRLQAEFDNFRRRTREEDARRRQEALEAVIRDLLPIVDNMERAVQATGSGAQADQSIREGVTMIFQQLRAFLESRGVTPAPGVGERFDPQWHHAIGTVQADNPDGDAEAGDGGGGDDELVVIEEFQKGYILGGRAIRPSLVTVGPRSALPQGSDTRKGNER